ncbi:MULTISPECIES: histidine phosphatase family protein [unclassified Serratia (in: enterobacteria)]|uniref:histidine phosphatase family protein n=1 Tax=unclassified Serratia (in: enterobacteria) TaxID=2647522 RepID=UPI000468F4AE|nr:MULTISPECIES: histidine phosphatase family protein [unclassified Serratia (in: enterobacteria)]
MKKKIIPLVTLLLAMVWLPGMALSQTTVPIPHDQANAEQPKTLRFYLVRHGQTYSNIKEMTIGGGGNAQLTPKGRYDASSLGLGLAEVEFIAGYSSTLGRAYETANQILRGRNMPVKQIEDLKDISWGDAEGGRIDDLTAKFGHSGNDFAFYFGTYNDPAFKSPVNAENMSDFSARFENALRQIAAQHPNENGNILVTAHSSMAFYLQKYRANQPLAGLANTSVSVLELNKGKFHLIDFNNTDYLKSGYAREKALSPLEIILIVNPLTQLQQAGVMEGTTDSDFTAAGEKANQQLHQALKSTRFIAAYSSELGRGYKTAQRVMADHQIPIQQDNQLNEMFLGHWEAEKVATLKGDPSKAARDLFSANNLIHFVSPDEGESGENAAYRLDKCLSAIGQKYEFSQGKVIVFTHPLVLNAFFNKRLPDSSWQPSQSAQVVTLTYKNETFSVQQVK